MTNDTEKDSVLERKEILLLEDDVLLRKRLAATLEKMGGEVTTVTNLKEARTALAEMLFDFLLLDLNLPDGLSLVLLQEGLVPENAITVIMTAEGGVTFAVQAMRLGAADYLAKPFDFEELPLVFRNAEAANRRERRREHIRESSRKAQNDLFFKESFAEDLVQLQRILDADSRLSQSLPPVLIEGPTGSGKSSYARWLHENGPRTENPMVELNCSTIPENLVESELFGHEKGAFTDAKGSRIGLFEAADGGTLFLDELTRLSPTAQAKVLVAIEEGKIRRVGGTKELHVDVRVIGAANRNLREMVEEGSFRGDLFHRLDLFRIRIKPLTDRGNGILALAQHFLSSLGKKYKLQTPEISSEGSRRLLAHAWPGNARELAHELERSLVMSDPSSSLSFPHLTEMINQSPSGQTHGLRMDSGADWLAVNWRFPEQGFDLEEAVLRLIRKAIEESNGNVSAAARKLGVPRDYVRYRLQKTKEGS